MRVINLIPKNYKGNPRNALGYAWKDLENKIPGEDIIIESGSIHKSICKSLFECAIDLIDEDSWNWSYVDREIIALINCMWCGGCSYKVYKSDFLEFKNNISIKEESSDKNHGVGWCPKCESYCFGDCESN